MVDVAEEREMTTANWLLLERERRERELIAILSDVADGKFALGFEVAGTAS